MPLTEQSVRDALKGVKYPGFSRDIVSFGLVKGIAIEGADVRVSISLATRDPGIPQQILETSMAALEALAGAGHARVEFDIVDPPRGATGTEAEGTLGKASIPGIRRVIAVASGKGGVGKSTVAVNLAVALALDGASVGLCDCDLYGPSIALMLGADEHPLATADNRILPLHRHGVALMSMGVLLEDDSPVIVRGPMATRYTQQFLRHVEWGDLDYLVLDLPPGTGDIQLTIVQTVALDGALIVTTPQEVALIDARKAAAMFQKVNVPILGIIENMSYFECPSDGKRYDIFGSGGGAREAARLKVPLLGEIPIDIATREQADAGVPVVTLPPEGNPAGGAFRDIARRLQESLSRRD